MAARRPARTPEMQKADLALRSQLRRLRDDRSLTGWQIASESHVAAGTVNDYLF